VNIYYYLNQSSQIGFLDFYLKKEDSFSPIPETKPLFSNLNIKK
jgi:hypothetical protein